MIILVVADMVKSIDASALGEIDLLAPWCVCILLLVER